MKYWLRSWRELASPIHCAVFNMGNIVVSEHIAIAICNAEGVGARAHAGVCLDKVVVVCTRDGYPLAALIKVFEFGDWVAMIADLHSCPPLIASVFEMISDWPI